MNVSNRRWIFAGFFVYGVALFLVLTVYRLPSEKLLEKGVHQFTGGKVILNAARVSPTFPPGYRLENVEYSILLNGGSYKNNLKSLNIYPDYLGLMKGYLPLTMKGLLPRGGFEIEAGTSILKGSKDGYLALKASGAYLDDFGFLRSFTGRTLKGKVNGEVNLKGDLMDYTRISGDGRLSLEEGTVESQLPLFGSKEIPFENLRISFTMKEGLLSLREAELVGPVFSGRISGDLRLKNPFEQTLLHLTARLTPGSQPTANDGVRAFPAGKDGLMVVKVEGMLRNPHVLWGQ